MSEPRLKRTVEIHNGYPRLRFPLRKIAEVIDCLDRAFQPLPADFPSTKGNRRSTSAVFQVPSGDLSIAFLSDAKMSELHGTFLDDPTPTDVITFEGDPTAGLAGEICVSVDTARTYAKKHKRIFSEELTLYVVHGWLHLAGYDDLVSTKKRKMRAAEERAMKLLHRWKKIPEFKCA